MTLSNTSDLAVVDEPPEALGPRLRLPAPPTHRVGQAPAHTSDDPAGWPMRLLPAALVCAAHAGLLWWMSETLLSHEPTVIPPAVVGMLVTPPPMTEPTPRPVDTTPPPPAPAPAPQPAAKPKPVKPPPPAAPSERAVSAPPPQPPAPAQPETVPEPAPVPAPAPAPAVAAEPKDAPATPPRSDAAHLNNPAPVYPPGSQRLGEQGTVMLDVYILANGTVGEIKLKRTSGHSRLDQAALDAVRRWRYQPARRGNEPIPYWYVQPIHFSLDN